ncbi:hypothetical protein [Vulcaniibacterium tengchongense]|uniref:Uncharacterized protein n=1 Tax=Vulcaniibacterium tengchongense TaxID=1273429 RepID=A0A3N4VK61_9GAMM|nr:hypothetical protein [Vulcaniibacterium tengchongense]RPE81825.1 hypothetical protein EDC50_1027 [Vulcaniibacterium tengchongense]
MQPAPIPQCCECGCALRIVEPFTGGVSQQVRCPSCGVQLRVRRLSVIDWRVITAADHAGQRSRPLPAVAPPQLKARFFEACRSVARLLSCSEGVEPGMAEVADD